MTDDQIADYCRCTPEQAGAARTFLGLKAVACIKLSARQRWWE